MADFVLDISKGMTHKQVCDAYRRASRNSIRWQNIALMLARKSPDALATLPDSYREEINNLIEALKD